MSFQGGYPTFPDTSGGGGPPSGPAGGVLSGTYPNPSFNHAAFEAELALFFTKITTEVWIGPALDPGVMPKGTPLAPFPDYASAMTYVSGRTEEYFKIHVAPGISGNLTIPANKGIFFESSIEKGININNLIVNGSTDDKHQIFFQGLEKITTVDFVGVPTDASTLVFLDFIDDIGNVTNSGGINVFLVCAAASDIQSSLPSVTFHVINIGPTGVVISRGADHQGAITAGSINLFNCIIPPSLFCSGNLIQMTGSQFPGAPVSITFTGPLGQVVFDAETTGNFAGNLGTITNGVLVRDHELVTQGMTFVTPPTLEGQVYTYVGNHQIDLAKAVAPILCKAIAGVYDNESGKLATVRGRHYPIRCEPNLVGLSGGVALFVSKLTAGLATHIAPAMTGDLDKCIGYVVDATGYNGLDPTGSPVLGFLHPEPLVIHP